MSCLPGAAVDVRTEGGGSIAKKCGCLTNGTLATGVDVEFLGQ